jgi:hypothetical protein
MNKKKSKNDDGMERQRRIVLDDVLVDDDAST